MMSYQPQMMFTLWDVEHGLAIWIKTPAGHNHWIDAGYNSTTDFSPARHVRQYYGEQALDYLIISHPDADHINGLPDDIRNLGRPRVLHRNQTLPETEKFGTGLLDYQRVFRSLDQDYSETIPWEADPCNPAFNGGITVHVSSLGYHAVSNLNDTSLVAFYLYAGFLFVCPGDITPAGWNVLWLQNAVTFSNFARSAVRVLVAPHHGRGSCYCQEMMDAIAPHLVLISDKYGQEPTDPRFRTCPSGVRVDGELIRFISTKTSGRVQTGVNADGSWWLDRGEFT